MNRLEYTMFRPNKDGKGAGAVLNFNPETGDAYLSMMPQNGEKSFDSQAKLNAKLGQNDIGEILAVLTGRTNGLGTEKDGKWSGLLHTSGQNKERITVIGLSPYQGRLYLSVSVKVNKTADATRLSVGLSHGDEQNLRLFFEEIGRNMLVSTYEPAQTT